MEISLVSEEMHQRGATWKWVRKNLRANAEIMKGKTKSIWNGSNSCLKLSDPLFHLRVFCENGMRDESKW